MKRILIVEDDLGLCQGIALALKSDALTFEGCHSLEEARKILHIKSIDLVILDINLPDGSGFELLQEIKAASNTPVICLTANDLETDIVTGFELGADDYVTKPFSLMVLRARVNNQLRKEKMTSSEIFSFGKFYFDFEHMIFRKEEEIVELSKTEQKLLRLLVTNKGQILTRQKLVDHIWTDSAEYVDENALSVTIKRLRGKLEKEPANPVFIKTIYGKGYMWAVAQNDEYK